MLNSSSKFLLLAFMLIGSTALLAQNEARAEVDRHVSISERPDPVFPDEARKNKVKGKIRLRVEFRSDRTIGEVTDVTTKKSDREKLAKHGLTPLAIEAAKKIRFEPAIKGGVPVTVFATIEY